MRNTGEAISPHQACEKIQQRQHGAIHRSQAISTGMTGAQIKTLVSKGTWFRALPQVFCSTSSPRTRVRDLMILSLWCGDRGAVSHLSAAGILRLRVPASERLEITVTNRRPSPRCDVIVHYSSHLPHSDVETAQAIRLTTPTRTLVDLAGTLTEEELEIALDDALRRGLTSIPRLYWQLGRSGGRGRRGSVTMRRILHVRSDSRHADSGLETKIARVLRRSALERAVPQHALVIDNTEIARFDFAWPDARVAVECESYEWHFGRQAWRRDTTKLNEVAADGWIVIRATEEDARNPADFIARLSRILPKRKRASAGFDS